MIFDKLENIERYGFQSEFVAKIKQLSISNFIKGKFEMGSDSYFGIGLEYNTQDASKALWEAHRKNLDFHIILEGEEKVFVSDIAKSVSVKDYEDDYELFDTKKEQEIHLRPGYFLILYPNEVHKTTIALDQKVLVKKNVLKYVL